MCLLPVFSMRTYTLRPSECRVSVPSHAHTQKRAWHILNEQTKSVEIKSMPPGHRSLRPCRSSLVPCAFGEFEAQRMVSSPRGRFPDALTG